MGSAQKKFKISSVIMNLAIIFLLAVLVFMIYEIFATSRERKNPQPLPLAQEQKSVTVQPTPAVSVPVSPVAAPSTASSATPHFTIQAGSFQDKAKADSVAGSLKKKGYLPTVETADLGAKGIWYRVYVGGFATKEEAQGFLEAIKKDNPSAFIKQL